MSNHEAVDIRTELARRFRVVPAPLITAFTGSALPNSTPPFGGASQITQFVSVWLFLFAGVFGGHLLLKHVPEMPVFTAGPIRIARSFCNWTLWLFLNFYTLCCTVPVLDRVREGIAIERFWRTARIAARCEIIPERILLIGDGGGPSFDSCVIPDSGPVAWG